VSVFSSVVGFSGDACITATLTTVTSSAAIVLGPNALFAIRTSAATINAGTGADFNLFFENSAGGQARAAAATDFQFAGNTVYYLQTGDHADTVKIFNPGSASIVYWIQKLDRF
jgi:hypothetical protein